MRHEMAPYKDRRLKTLDPRLKMSRMTDKDKSKTLEPRCPGTCGRGYALLTIQW